MPLKNHKKFNVGKFMKLRKEEQDRVLKENTKLLNCIENEERKLKTQRMKLKRLQSKVDEVQVDCNMLSQGLNHATVFCKENQKAHCTLQWQVQSRSGSGSEEKK